jgi:hypothetical protein
MKELARYGAQARLASLIEEMDAILVAFPELGKEPARPAEAKRSGVSEATKAKMRASWAKRKAETAQSEPVEDTPAEAPKVKGTRTMSAEARARISAAQKKRWAKQRRAKKG